MWEMPPTPPLAWRPDVWKRSKPRLNVAVPGAAALQGAYIEHLVLGVGRPSTFITNDRYSRMIAFASSQSSRAESYLRSYDGPGKPREL